MMRRLIAVVVPVVILLLCARFLWVESGVGSEGHAERSGEPAPSVLAHSGSAIRSNSVGESGAGFADADGAANSRYGYSPGAPIEQSDDLIQYYRVALGAQDQLVLQTTEVSGGQQHYSEETISTVFDITTVGTRFANELFVGGRTARGWGVVEKWRRVPRVGGPVTGTGAAGGGAIGVPSAPITEYERAYQGGAPIPFPDREGAVRLGRTEILLGAEVSVPDEIGVDPEGRFLLIIAEDGNLYQVDLSHQVPSLSLVYESVDVPPLADACSLTVGQHQTYGRIWFVRSQLCGGAKDALLFDYDNDGVFDDFLVSTSLQIAVSDYYDREKISFY